MAIEIDWAAKLDIGIRAQSKRKRQRMEQSIRWLILARLLINSTETDVWGLDGLTNGEQEDKVGTDAGRTYLMHRR